MISLNIGSVIGYGIGNTKINELELPANEDKIRGFEVGVYDFLLMNHMYGL